MEHQLKFETFEVAFELLQSFPRNRIFKLKKPFRIFSTSSQIRKVLETKPISKFLCLIPFLVHCLFIFVIVPILCNTLCSFSFFLFLSFPPSPSPEIALSLSPTPVYFGATSIQGNPSHTRTTLQVSFFPFFQLFVFLSFLVLFHYFNLQLYSSFGQFVPVLYIAFDFCRFRNVFTYICFYCCHGIFQIFFT